MTSDDSRLRVIESDDVLRVEFVDRSILDEAHIKQIGDELTGLVMARDSPKIILIFRHVEHLSSAALGTLITVHNKVKGKSGQLRLAEIDDQIREVFEITRLNTLFDIHDTEQSALSSLT